MSIYLIEGGLGAGKTTFACILMDEWQKRYERMGRVPRALYSNVQMDIPGVEVIEKFSEIKLRQQCIVVIDEAQMFFSARNWQDNAEHIGYFTQQRKNGLTLYLVCPSVDQLDVNLRERSAAGIWRVARLFGPDIWEEPSWIERHFGWWSLCSLYDPEYYGVSSKETRKRRRLIRLDEWHNRFDTLNIVQNRESGGRKGAGLIESVSQAQTRRPAGPENAPEKPYQYLELANPLEGLECWHIKTFRYPKPEIDFMDDIVNRNAS